MSAKPEFTPPSRITLRTIFEQLMSHLNLEKGMLYTLWALLVYPGKAIHYYLEEDRKKLVKPLGFVFLLVGLSTYLMITVLEGEVIKNVEIALEEELAPHLKLEAEKKTALRINTIIFQYRNAIQLSGIPLLALISFLFFRNHRLNYAEHLVLGCYVIGYVSWISMLGALLFFFFGKIHLLIFIAGLSVFYQFYFYWSVFAKSWSSLLNSVALNLIYFSTFTLLTIVLLFLLINFMV